MGTEVFLSWKSMPKEQFRLQLETCEGRHGYLSAGVLDRVGNHLLEMVFPEPFFSGKYRRKKFNAEELVQIKAIKPVYLEAVTSGKGLIKEGCSRTSRWAGAVESLLAKGGFHKGLMNGAEALENAKDLFQQLIDFYNLGLEKENAGLEPKVCISW